LSVLESRLQGSRKEVYIARCIDAAEALREFHWAQERREGEALPSIRIATFMSSPTRQFDTTNLYSVTRLATTGGDMQTQWQATSFRPASFVVAALVTMLALPLTSTAAAQSSGNPSVYPTAAMPFGKSYTQWTVQWWKWALGLPLAGHPFNQDGFVCNSANNGQSGPVWFLASSSMPPLVQRSCAIPQDTAVLVGLTTVECSDLEPLFPDGTGGATEAQRRACATYFANHVVISSLFCTIDGRAVTNLGSFRFPSPEFTFTAPTPWVFGATGGTGHSVGDGYYVMLKPLASGTHAVSCGGTFHFSVADGDGFDADLGFGNSYQLTVNQE
jgi:hypothetical protein